MSTSDNGDDPYSLRKRLVDAADDTALAALTVDSTEVAAVAIEALSGTIVPDEVFTALRSNLPRLDPAATARLLEIVRPYRPPDEPEMEVEDRVNVLQFAASVVEAAFDPSLTARERAKDAAYVLADLHAHVNGLAADEFLDEDERRDLRPQVIDRGEAYDDFCMRRHNDLLILLADVTSPGDPGVRASAEQGKDLLRRALVSLIAADRI